MLAAALAFVTHRRCDLRHKASDNGGDEAASRISMRQRPRTAYKTITAFNLKGGLRNFIPSEHLQRRQKSEMPDAPQYNFSAAELSAIFSALL